MVHKYTFCNIRCKIIKVLILHHSFITHYPTLTLKQSIKYKQ